MCGNLGHLSWLLVFCEEMISMGLDMILKHLVSSAIKDTKASVTCDSRLLINTANRSGQRMLP